MQLGDLASFVYFAKPDPPFCTIRSLEALKNGMENYNINVYRYGSSLNESFVAVGDLWLIYEFDPRTLAVTSPVRPAFPEGGVVQDLTPVPSPAHPVRESGTSDYISLYVAISMLPFEPTKINIIRIKSPLRRELIASIPHDWVPYMHSLAVSPNYAIVFAHPVVMDWVKMAECACVLDALSWQPELGTSIYVVHLRTGAVTTFRGPSVVNMHVINSWEEGQGQIIVDMVTYANIDAMKAYELSNLKSKSKRQRIASDSTLIRYTLDLSTKETYLDRFNSTPGLELANSMDMPFINPKCHQRRSCIVFGRVIVTSGTSQPYLAIVKKNLCHGGKDQIWRRPYHYASEPWFLPKPGGVSEDDGAVFTVVLDGLKKTSYIAILDGRTMTLMSFAVLPTVVPFTLHGRIFDSHKDGL